MLGLTFPFIPYRFTGMRADLLLFLLLFCVILDMVWRRYEKKLAMKEGK